MKRIALGLLLTVLCAAAFTSCGHGHVYDQRESTDEFKKADATCTDVAVYYYSCLCGERGEETYEHGAFAPHTLAHGVCSDCGYVEYSSGLDFVSLGDGTCYVAGIGECTDTEVMIPTKSPERDTVIGIGEFAFQKCKNITRVRIPESVEYVGYAAFLECFNLSRVALAEDNALESIGAYAFADCNALESIDFLNNSKVTSIPTYAFYACHGLRKVVIPAGVTELGPCAFAYSNGITEVSFAEGSEITAVGEAAFIGCPSIYSVELSHSITSIESEAFVGAKSLVSITVPATVASIADNAFAGCFKLVEIVNHSSVEITLGEKNTEYTMEVHSGESKIDVRDGYVFYSYGGVNYLLGYRGEESTLVLPESYNGQGYEIYQYFLFDNKTVCKIVIPDAVTAISENAFTLCSSLSRVEFGENIAITTIPRRAFNSCTSLESIIIPDGVTVIEEYAFVGCSALVSITIPVTVTSIAEDAFAECLKLVEIVNHSSVEITLGEENTEYTMEVHSGESKIDVRDGYVFYSHGGVNYLLGYRGEESVLILPESYNGQGYEIYQYFLNGNKNVTEVVIPDAVTAISENAFSLCSALSRVEFGENIAITRISRSTFYNCTSLESIIIPDGVTVIEEYAFIGCRTLVSITVPASVTRVGKRAFDVCPALKEVYYGGSSEEWRAISAAEGNAPFINATRHYGR